MTTMHIKSVGKLLALIFLISYTMDKLIYLTLNNIDNKVFTGQSVGKLNHYLSVKDTTDFLVFGSSRANHHFNTKMLDNNSFNMGVDGRDIAYFSTLIKLLPKNRSQFVLINIDPENVFDREYDGADIAPLAIKYHSIKPVADALENAGQYNPLQKIYWSIDYNSKAVGVMMNFLRPKYNYKTYDGYDPLVLNETQKQIRGAKLKTPETADCPETYQESKLYLDYLQEIVAFCKKNNKTLLAVTSPIYHDSCDRDNTKLAALMKAYDVAYWDYTHFFDENNSLEWWKDSGHLSKAGADKFTGVLAKRIQESYNNDEAMLRRN